MIGPEPDLTPLGIWLWRMRLTLKGVLLAVALGVLWPLLSPPVRDSSVTTLRKVWSLWHRPGSCSCNQTHVGGARGR